MADNATPLARIVPKQIALPGPVELTQRAKAAIIVKFLLADGANLPIASLPDEQQTALAEQMSKMRVVTRDTLQSVIAEFADMLEQVGLTFPSGIEGTLSAMDGHISPATAAKLRRNIMSDQSADPWDRVAAAPIETIIQMIERESVDVAAVILAKLPVAKSAEILGKCPGEQARRIAYAISRTGNVMPDTVKRIGQALVGQMDQQPDRAFKVSSVERYGAILNVTSQALRDDLLNDLESQDLPFAEQVKKAIFTFAHIPYRVTAKDVSKVMRVVDAETMVTALVAAKSVPDQEIAGEFLLSNVSQRMAQSMREEIEARGQVKLKDGEAAMSAVIQGIRQLEASGELTLISQED